MEHGRMAACSFTGAALDSLRGAIDIKYIAYSIIPTMELCHRLENRRHTTTPPVPDTDGVASHGIVPRTSPCGRVIKERGRRHERDGGRGRNGTLLTVLPS